MIKQILIYISTFIYKILKYKKKLHRWITCVSTNCLVLASKCNYPSSSHNIVLNNVAVSITLVEGGNVPLPLLNMPPSFLKIGPSEQV